jgi:mersacidin/lichenicidin family type 2 lantibiotic
MSNRNIIRAWKDEEYRLSLSDAERAQLPAHPAGMIEVTDADLGVVSGGLPTNTNSLYCSHADCPSFICTRPIQCVSVNCKQ